MSKKSYSQLGQDLWVVDRTGGKRNGFFIEAGACDGLHLSNTYLLESQYGWNGICCEPNPEYYSQLINNRRCVTDPGVLYDQEGQSIEFYSAGEEGGTLDDFKQEPRRLANRSSHPKIMATTISLNTLLEKHGAPEEIDYISLDTEGSELRILRLFDFSRWKVSLFSVEHNTQHRDDGTRYVDSLIGLMREQGFSHEMNRWDMYFF